MSDPTDILDALAHRFGDAPPREAADRASASVWQTLAQHRSCRSYKPDPVGADLLRTLAALALSAPSKSDLQQRDIVVVENAETRARLDALLRSDWIAGAPVLLVFCGNNRRQRQIHDWREKPFANDHLDAFFNAAVDAGIALATFVMAAESIGLGCCPLSAIRNHAAEVGALLDLPDWVFPVAGLTVGWPAAEGEISLRLPLDATVHIDRYGDDEMRANVDAYDARRAGVQPYAHQRKSGDYGESPNYGWSEDKARQYTEVQRADFGTFIRRKGFDLT